jgi:hypothetical protein
MVRSKFIGVILIVVAGIVLASASFQYGKHAQRTEWNFSLAHTQAKLAFAHYKANEEIESLLLRKCYDAALTQAQGQKNLELTLLYENLRETGNDPELVEYIKIRAPKLLETVLSGRVTELKSFTTTCP